MKVAVIYWTGTGNTEAMAEEIALGARDEGAEVFLCNVGDTDATTALQYDRLALGCPAMGIEELEDFEMGPFVEDLLPQIQGKDCILFGSCGWSQGQWLQKWAVRMHEAGAQFLQAPLRCTGYPDEASLMACREAGKILATDYEN